MKNPRIFLVFTLLGFASFAQAQNLITANPGFEESDFGWGVFIPKENAAHDLKFEVVDQGARSGRRAARLSAGEISRFAISNKTMIEVVPGESYRLSAWYRAEPGAIVANWGPGFVLRATFFDADRKAAANNLHIGPGGAVSESAGRDIRLPSLATAWTRVSAVITIPEGVTRMQLNVFLWGMEGALLVDDVMVEQVPAK